MAQRGELLYPKFLECCQFTEDTYWKFVFEDLACGKSPYGTYLTKNFLCCNYKDKEFSYKIDINKDSKRLYQDIFELLHNKFGLLSNKDKIKQRELFEIEKESDSIEDNDWQNIKKKKY